MKHIKKYIKFVFLILTIIIITGGILLKIKLTNNKDKIKTEEIKYSKKEEKIETEIKEPQKVFVDIKGAVNNPGVYEIEENKKVIDVINLAGNFTDNADTSLINLAKKVTNEMVIIIYTKEEVKKATEPNQIIKYVDKKCICPEIKNDACINNSTKKESSTSSINKDITDSKDNKKDVIINLNTATLEELQTLSGIGESKAEAIIQYREEHGGFQSIEELKDVPGIGDSLYEKIKDSITI